MIVTAKRVRYHVSYKILRQWIVSLLFSSINSFIIDVRLTINILAAKLWERKMEKLGYNKNKLKKMKEKEGS